MGIRFHVPGSLARNILRALGFSLETFGQAVSPTSACPSVRRRLTCPGNDAAQLPFWPLCSLATALARGLVRPTTPRREGMIAKGFFCHVRAQLRVLQACISGTPGPGACERHQGPPNGVQRYQGGCSSADSLNHHRGRGADGTAARWSRGLDGWVDGQIGPEWETVAGLRLI